jgi:hypothetical protein
MTEQTPEVRPKKRRRLFLATSLALVALALGAFLVWPYFIPTAWIEKATQAVIAGTLARPMSIGSVRVTRLGQIRMDEVVIWRDAERTGPLIRWESFNLSVKLLALLRGRIDVDRVSVEQPELFLRLTEGGRPALELPPVVGSGAVVLLVGQALVREGTVTLLNPDFTPRLTVRHVNFSGRLGSPFGPFVFRLAFSAPDASEGAGISLEGELSIAEEARELTWDALRGRVALTLEGFDWQDASTPPELKDALADLPSGLLRKADVKITLVRRGDKAVEAEGNISVGQLSLTGKGGRPLQLADASLSGAGRYEVASGAMEMERLHFLSPWLDAQFAGRLEPLAGGLAVEGSSRGRLTLEGMPRAGREALAGQGLAVEGPITWEADVKAGPERTAVSGALGLEEATVKLAGLNLRRSGEPGRVSFDLERVGEPWTIHRLELQAPEGTVQMVGKVNWKPPQRTTVDLRVTSRVRAERLAERWYELNPESRLALAAFGEMKAEATVRGLIEGLTLTGSLDATDALLAVGPLALKSRGEQATVKAALELKKNTLLVRKADVSLPAGSASLRGRLPLEASRPRYDFKASLSLDVDELQRRLDDEVLWLPPGVTVSGSAKADAALNRFQQALNLQAEVDATALEIHWGLDGKKPSGTPARLKLASNFERGAEVEEFALQLGPAAVALAGQVAEDWKSASLRYRGSVAELSALAPMWQPLAAKEAKGGVSARGTLEWSGGRTALNGSVDFQKASITLAGEPSVGLGLQGAATHSPTSFSTEGLILSVDGQPITITGGLVRSDSRLEVLSMVEAGRVDLTNLLARLRGPSGSEPSLWGPIVASAVKEGLKLHGRIRAEELKLDSYPLTNLAMEVKASEGVLQVPLFSFGLNGGEEGPWGRPQPQALPGQGLSQPLRHGLHGLLGKIQVHGGRRGARGRGHGGDLHHGRPRRLPGERPHARGDPERLSHTDPQQLRLRPGPHRDTNESGALQQQDEVPVAQRGPPDHGLDRQQDPRDRLRDGRGPGGTPRPGRKAGKRTQRTPVGQPGGDSLRQGDPRRPAGGIPGAQGPEDKGHPSVDPRPQEPSEIPGWDV